MILHTTLWWQCQNIDQTLNSKQTPHIPPWWASYRVSIVRIWEKIDHVVNNGIALYVAEACYRSTPHSVWWRCRSHRWWAAAHNSGWVQSYWPCSCTTTWDPWAVLRRTIYSIDWWGAHSTSRLQQNGCQFANISQAFYQIKIFVGHECITENNWKFWIKFSLVGLIWKFLHLSYVFIESTVDLLRIGIWNCILHQTLI